MAVAWAAGFAWFVRQAGLTGDLPPHCDGIIALTGGTERVETALRLLAEARAERLLISGVGGSAEYAALAHRAGVAAGLGPRVTLGRSAQSTRGNAVEAVEWARDFHVHTLIVVTAGYHMPRALAELSRTLPDVTLFPAPVQPSGWREGVGLGGLRLLGIEYTKFLAAEAGLSGLVTRPDEGRATHGQLATPQTERGGG
jgi:uncharacterized SAM-binding protein YcdF (DUF218 family)